MVLSYYLTRIPYEIVWRMLYLSKKTILVVFYCGDVLDYQLFQPVQKYLPPIPVVTDKKTVMTELRNIGVMARRLPVFPDAVIMTRHATHKFPSSRILKIGMRHGAYHFKRMTRADNYNQFDSFFMTSEEEVRKARDLGVTIASAIGFPKLDPAFDGTYNDIYQVQLKKKIGLSDTKPIILFTATWPKSGMSGVHIWYKHLATLTSQYQIMVTLHPWMDSTIRETVRNTPGVYYIDDKNAIPYIMLADICVGDTSSILAECCALQKPIVTFKVRKAQRTLEEIENLITRISWQVDTFDELKNCIEYGLQHKEEKQADRDWANSLMFDKLDGKAGYRAASAIYTLLPDLKRSIEYLKIYDEVRKNKI